MNQNTCRPVLAIGLDAAEPSLIRRLIDQDEMPALKSLLAEGKWMRVQSPAHLGSGSDQHGWIRINLRGRESAGIVLAQDYNDTCRQLEDLMRGLSRKDGQPLVDEVIRTSDDHEEARFSKLPDLVVHWSDAAFAANAGINDSAVPIKTIGMKFTAQHAPDGFCILKGGNDLCQTDLLSARDMHLLITGLLTGARNQAKGVSDEST